MEVKVWDSRDQKIVKKFVETLNTVFSEGEFTESFFLWKHRDNPFGSSIVTYAESEDGRIAAVRCLWKSRVTYDGDSYIAYQPCDTATHPNFRRQGLFTSITKLAVERAKEEQAKFIYNFPNDQSKPGYIKLGWQEGCEVVKMFKVIRPLSFACQMLRNRGRIGAFKEVDGGSGFSEAGFKSYLEKGDMERSLALQEEVAITERSREYIEWRFQNHPRNKYGILAKGKAGLIFRLGERGKLREISIVDIWLSDENKCDKDIRRLLDSLKENYNPDIISVIMTEQHIYRQSFKGVGFMKAKNNFGFVKLGLDKSLDMEKIKWQLLASDIDTF